MQEISSVLNLSIFIIIISIIFTHPVDRVGRESTTLSIIAHRGRKSDVEEKKKVNQLPFFEAGFCCFA